MSKVKVKLISKGVKQLLKSEAMMDACKEAGKDIAGRCGSGYAVGTYVAGSRAVATVYAASDKAKLDNSRNNTLLKAVGG